jgi:Flp pilus assembly protein TadG
MKNLILHKIFRKRSFTAQGMVEFALVLPLLLLVIFGVIELGRLFVIYASTLTASREAARYGSAAGTNAAGVRRYLDCDGIEATADRMMVLAGVSNIEIWYDGGPGVDLPPQFDSCPATGTVELGYRINVRVEAQYEPFLGLTPLPGFTMRSEAARTIVMNVSIVGNPPGVPTSTSTATNTSSPTATSTATNTSTPTETPTPTLSPTATSTDTPGPSPTPSNTPSPTLSPTITNTPTPTSTSTPTFTPTPTPTIAVACSDLDYETTFSHDTYKLIFNWKFINTTNASSFTLTTLTIPWVKNPGTLRLNLLTLDANDLWSGTDTTAGATFGLVGPPSEEFEWTLGTQHVIEKGPARVEFIEFWFSEQAKSNVGTLIAVFRIDLTGELCTYSATQQ